MPKSYAAIQESEEASIAESFTPAEYEQLKTMFNYFDTDSDRMLSIKEAINLWGLLGYTTSAYDISKFGHDKINLTTFVQMTKHYKEKSENDPESAMNELYKMLDRHDRQVIEVPELRAGLRLCGISEDNLTDDHMASLISSLSQSRDYGWSTSFTKEDYQKFVRDTLAKSFANKGL